MNRLIYVLVTLLLVANIAVSQGVNKSIENINKDFESLAYKEVIAKSEYLLRKGNITEPSLKNEVVKKLALSFFYTKNYPFAERYLKEYLESASQNNSEADLYLKLAQVLSSNGKHSESSEVWNKYSELIGGNEAASDFAYIQSNPEPLNRNAGSYLIEYLPINSSGSEFSPTFYGDGLVFVSGRPSYAGIRRIFAWDDSPFLDLYFLEDRNSIVTNQSAKVGGAQSKEKRKNALGQAFYSPNTANDGNKLTYNTNSSSYSRAELPTSKLDKKTNSAYHDGPCDFFSNDQSVIFTRNGIGNYNYESADGINRLHLYIADNVDGKWSDLRSFPFNSAEYSTGHPAFMPSEKILYFVSDMKGGFGGTDLYYSKFENGKWHKPQNAGNRINTSGNEMFPFIDEANNLFFASDGHPGLGGLDLFAIYLSADGVPMGNVQNLGTPLNSKWDDFGMYTMPDLQEGYFSSNRKNGDADDDIYKFIRVGDKFGCKELLLAAVDFDSGKPIPGVAFTYYEINTPENVKSGFLNSKGETSVCLDAEGEFYFEFEDKHYEFLKQYISVKELPAFKASDLVIKLKKVEVKEQIVKPAVMEPQVPLVMFRTKDQHSPNLYKGVISGQDGNPLVDVLVRFVNKCSGEVSEQKTNSNGEYSFKRDIDCDYEFIAIKTGYSTNYEFVGKEPKKNIIAKVIDVVKKDNSKSESFFDPTIFRVGDVIKMDNIYYESDEYNISASAKADMDHFAEALQKYPQMVIEITSHTDSRGNALDNLKLSQQRANEVKAYLVKRGIAGNRIKAVGMGEKSPVNNCGDGIQCTEAEHRRNRRTEFKILQIERI